MTDLNHNHEEPVPNAIPAGRETACIRAAEILKYRGLNGADAAARALGLPPSSRPESVLEGVMREAIKLNLDGSAAELLSAAADAYCLLFKEQEDDWRGEDFGTWSHSLCHNFECYGNDYSTHVSILTEAHNRTVAEQLVAEAVERCIARGYTACLDRIIAPIIRLNMDHMNIDNLRAPFAFFPTSLGSEELYRIYSKNAVRGVGDHAADICDFISSRNLGEYLSKKLLRGSLPELEEDVLLVLLQRLEESMPEELAARPAPGLPELDGEAQSVRGLRESMEAAMAAREIEPGAFVDVEGTLLLRRELQLRFFQESQVPLWSLRINQSVARSMIALAEDGMQVKLITGGNVQRITDELRAEGVEERFLPVLPKSAFKGKKFELLIDDTIPAYQGLSAVAHLGPSQRLYGDERVAKIGGEWRWSEMG